MHVNVLAYREHVLEPEIQIYWVSSLTVKYGDLFTVSENKKIRFEWQPIRKHGKKEDFYAWLFFMIQ